MFGVLAEDKSDCDTLKTLIRRIAGDDRIPIKAKGFNGCSELLNKGKAFVNEFNRRGAEWFVICMDADSDDAAPARKKLLDRVVTPSGLTQKYCTLVPIQEIEAWIIADARAVNAVIPSFRFSAPSNPEQIPNPKEWIERISRRKSRPLYSHATHNPRVAEHIDLDLLATKCASFHPLRALVTAAIS